jgi:Holliday junction resolvase
MPRINANRKGKVGEREWRDVLRAHGWEARRGQQFCGTKDSPDVISNNPIVFEVKRVESYSPRELLKWVSKAKEDQQGLNLTAVAHRTNGGEWLLTFNANDFLAYQNKKERREGAKGNSNETNAPIEEPAVPQPQK